MTALDVVRIDFQLRFGVHRRILRQQQVFVGLARVGFLSVFLHHDFAVEYSMRMTAKYALIELQTARPWLRVLDLGEIVDMLSLVAQIKAVEHAPRPFSVENNTDVVSH